MNAQSAFADIRGTRIHYLDWAGDGPPILIVHGNTHAGGVYEPLGNSLSRDHRVVALDMRGHGLSDKPGDYGWEKMRDDIIGLIDHLSLVRPLIVAHSRGAGISMLVLGARPQNVRGLVAFEPTIPLQILNPAMDAEARRVWSEKRLARSENRRSTYPSREAAYDHYIGRGAFKHWPDDYLRAFIKHCLVDLPDGTCELASPITVEADLVRARLGLGGWDLVQGCDVPVLAIYGELSDRLGGEEDPIATIASLFKRSSAVVMKDASHSGPMEHPDEFERLIREFDGMASGGS